MSGFLQPHWLCPPGPSIHGIFQAIMMEQISMFSPRGSSRLRDWTQVSCISCTSGFFTTSATCDAHSSIYSSAKTRPGAACGSNHQLLIAKFRIKLKKVGKTSRPVRYDLNQIFYDFTVEVTNRFKRLDLVNRVPEELWTKVHNIVQETVNKIILKKKKCKKAK